MTEQPASLPMETTTEAKRGRLWHGAHGLDISAAARTAGLVRTCGAAPRPRGERTAPCRNLAMRNGRCWLHGGRSTGPRTPEGLERAKRGRWKHGERSAPVRARRKALNALLRATAEALNADAWTMALEERLTSSLAACEGAGV
jgi:hypothetical protein